MLNSMQLTGSNSIHDFCCVYDNNSVANGCFNPLNPQISLVLQACSIQKGIRLCMYTHEQGYVHTQKQYSNDPCCRLSGYHMTDQQ